MTQRVNWTPSLSSHNHFACLAVDTHNKNTAFCLHKNAKVVPNPSQNTEPVSPPESPSPPTPHCIYLLRWERRLPDRYVLAASPGTNSLTIDMEIESTDTTVKRCTQALIDCGATSFFIDVNCVCTNKIPTCTLSQLIPVFNVDGMPNKVSMITELTNVVLCYEAHSEQTQLAVTKLGSHSILLGFNWLCEHNPEINWATKTVKMMHCPERCCQTCWLKAKTDQLQQKTTTSQIHTCHRGLFLVLIEEIEDEDADPCKGARNLEEGVQTPLNQF